MLLVAKEDRMLRIEVGYGLEGVMKDATAKRIVNEVIAPRLQEGDGEVSAGIPGELLRGKPARTSRNCGRCGSC